MCFWRIFTWHTGIKCEYNYTITIWLDWGEEKQEGWGRNKIDVKKIYRKKNMFSICAMLILKMFYNTYDVAIRFSDNQPLSVHTFVPFLFCFCVACPSNNKRPFIQTTIHPSIHSNRLSVRLGHVRFSFQLFIRIFTFNKLFLGGWLFAWVVGGCCYFWIYLEMKWFWIIEKERGEEY